MAAKKEGCSIPHSTFRYRTGFDIEYRCSPQRISSPYEPPFPLNVDKVDNTNPPWIRAIGRAGSKYPRVRYNEKSNEKVDRTGRPSTGCSGQGGALNPVNPPANSVRISRVMNILENRPCRGASPHSRTS